MSASEPQGPIALTMGEPAGIGGELALAAWRQRDSASVPPTVVLADRDWLVELAHRLGWDVPVEAIDDPAKAPRIWENALPVLPIKVKQSPRPGYPLAANADAVLASIETGVRLCGTGKCRALVTNPIYKAVLYERGFRYPGHTELLGALLGTTQAPVMMLTAEDLAPPLRVVPMTVHIALAEVPAALTLDRVLEHARAVHQALRQDFGFSQPRLGLAGLNPHAGEHGRLGREEETVLAPATATLKGDGIDITGPLPADSLFHTSQRGNFDAILCGFHDQALLPLKTLAFERGANVTLNLPIVRASPDHGTALNLAGSGEADPASLVAALHQADRIATNRARLAT